jgi:ELWxxDGT repeat protein
MDKKVAHDTRVRASLQLCLVPDCLEVQTSFPYGVQRESVRWGAEGGTVTTKQWLVCLGLVVLLVTAPAQAAPFRLVKDVYPGPSTGTSQYLVGNDAKLFFWGFDAGSPLAGAPFGSDGTLAGTGVIKQIGGSSEAFSQFQPKMANNGIVYFVANDGFVGNQVWRSDGTDAGTFVLTSGGVDSDRLPFTAFGDRVIFENGKAVGNTDAVTITDGSLVGTQVLSTAAYVNSAGVIVNGKAIFLGSSGNYALVVTDGTPGGTSAFTPAGLTSFNSYGGTNLVAVNDVAYFVGTDATHGTELWKTDGTPGGTAIVKDLFANAPSSYPQDLTRVDDRVFFIATTPDAGQELWVSDGTEGGTMRVKDIHSGLQDSSPGQLTALNGVVYFVANDGSTGKELWRSDGTEPGTIQALGDFNTQGSLGAFDYAYNTVQAINHKLALVLAATGASYTTIPYVSDGTLPGTHVIDASQTATVFYSGLTAVNGKLFASGTVQPSSYGNELIAVDAFAALGNTWCANPEQPIPDNAPAGFASHFHLPEQGGITKLTVSVDIGHARIGDLSFTLRHEQTGTEVVLFNQPACTGKLLDITLDDAGASNVQTTCANTRLAYPRDTHYSPASALAAFNGQSLKGDWTFTAIDHVATNVGILHEWCMSFTTDRVFADSFE